MPFSAVSRHFAYLKNWPKSNGIQFIDIHAKVPISQASIVAIT